MRKLTTLAKSGEIVVIETDSDRYIGTIEIDTDAQTVAVYNGFAGRPPVLDFCDILAASYARDHADVVPA